MTAKPGTGTPGGTGRSWLLRPAPRPDAAARLILFHHAGGSGNFYRHWAGALPEHVELVIVVLPGRERLRTLPFITDFEEAVRGAGAELASCLDRPFVVFGHSLGAHLAYRVLSRLEPGQAELLCHFVPSANHAPSWFQHVGLAPLSQQQDDEFMASFVARGAVPAQVVQTPGFLELLLPIFRADQLLGESIGKVPGVPKLDCPITAVGGQDDVFDRKVLEGWREIAGGPFAVRMFSGGHFYLDQALPALCDLLVASLAE